jgi:hypothetical protein
VTESSSGSDELQNRIHRRERSVRPPRKPRTDVETRSGEPPDDDKQQNHEAPSGATTASANSQAQPESDEIGSPEARSSGARPGAEEGARTKDLQRQIADAIAPVVDDLRRQIADTVRQQMQEAGEVSRQAPQSRETEKTKGAESHQAAGGDHLTQQDQKPETSPLGTTIQKAIAATRYAVRWLVHALRRAWVALMHGLRAFVVNVILGIATIVLRTLILGLIHRLEGKPEPKETDSEQSATSVSSA